VLVGVLILFLGETAFAVATKAGPNIFNLLHTSQTSPSPSASASQSSTSSSSVATATPTPAPTGTLLVARISVGHTSEYILNLGGPSISDTITIEGMSGNIGLAGHTLTATDDGASVTFTDGDGLGTIIDAGRGIRISSDAPGYTQIGLANNTGSTGTITVQVDNIVAFVCPPASDPNNRQVNCAGT